MDALEKQSDAWLMGAIVNGDADAVPVLLARYRQPLRALLSRTLGPDPEIDDVMQETWIRVIRSAHRYDPAQRFSAWLFSIAWNLMRNRWKRRESARAESLPDVGSAAASAEEVMLRDEQGRSIREKVDQLPERLAQAILLRYFEELSEREVAVRLGIPVGTVKSRVHSGLRKLAEAVEGGSR